MYWIAVIAIFAVLCVLCRDKTNRWRAIPVVFIIGSFFFKVWYLGVVHPLLNDFGLLSRFLNGVIAVFTKLSWLGLKWGLLVALVMIHGNSNILPYPMGSHRRQGLSVERGDGIFSHETSGIALDGQRPYQISGQQIHQK